MRLQVAKLGCLRNEVFQLQFTNRIITKERVGVERLKRQARHGLHLVVALRRASCGGWQGPASCQTAGLPLAWQLPALAVNRYQLQRRCLYNLLRPSTKHFAHFPSTHSFRGKSLAMSSFAEKLRNIPYFFLSYEHVFTVSQDLIDNLRAQPQNRKVPLKAQRLSLTDCCFF